VHTCKAKIWVRQLPSEGFFVRRQQWPLLTRLKSNVINSGLTKGQSTQLYIGIGHNLVSDRLQINAAKHMQPQQSLILSFNINKIGGTRKCQFKELSQPYIYRI
jgi:hypothetical protein